MGNNAAGYAIGTTLSALHKHGVLTWELCDAICEPWRGCDVDEGGLSDEERRSFYEAISSLFDRVYLGNDATDEEDILWYEEVERPFRRRYDFC